MHDLLRLMFWKWLAPVHVDRVDKLGGWACYDGDCRISVDGSPWRLLSCGEELDTKGATWLEWQLRPRLTFPRPASNTK